MGIRERLENNAGVAKLLVAAVVLVSAVVIKLEVKGPRRPAAATAIGKAFFSDDDGKTWFLDDAAKFPPFDHDGAQAYRAVVFRCKSGAPFVAFLAKYSARQNAQMADDARQYPGTPPRMQTRPPQDLKKPGQSKWFTYTAPSMTGYPDVPCPDGGGNATLVMPTDPDSGATN